MPRNNNAHKGLCHVSRDIPFLNATWYEFL